MPWWTVTATLMRIPQFHEIRVPRSPPTVITPCVSGGRVQVSPWYFAVSAMVLVVYDFRSFVYGAADPHAAAVPELVQRSTSGLSLLTPDIPSHRAVAAMDDQPAGTATEYP
ncbi:MAG: hypothetical protein DLM71_00080 [Chloroflexi bacterium]|nr:MAG: hypothetical protein DLM71_00080 [Chloroflexota bacterium]